MFYPHVVSTGLTMGVALLMAFGLWSWSRELTLPATWLVLMSGVTIELLPGRTATVVGSIIAIAVTAGVYGLWKATDDLRIPDVRENTIGVRLSSNRRFCGV